MNKYLKSFIKIAMSIVIFSVIGITVSLHYSSQQVKLTVEVCYDIADIEISKCQDFENGCINPKVLVNVIADSPNAKAIIRGGSGFYLIRNSYHGRRTIYIDEGETRYETFGCDKKEE